MAGFWPKISGSGGSDGSGYHLILFGRVEQNRGINIDDWILLFTKEYIRAQQIYFLKTNKNCNKNFFT